ncbi:GntR family transcriptional regulator [Kitasatospora sp. NPDC006697]|uniref:GntR family transcriptional regulator n=1 Tax=Kitasatospora sp. NPDC006697 TaxID=3364020 RepID=UPI003674C9A3
MADALRARITGGADEGRLPSEAQLMAAHGVARTTVRRALAVLEREGLVRSQPGGAWLVVTAGEQPPSLLDQLTALIGPASDQLSVGDRYPSEKELCERTGAARGTVRRALAQLEGAGVLEAQHGKGRVVLAIPETKNPAHSS